jgi:hypothetical protein
MRHVGDGRLEGFGVLRIACRGAVSAEWLIGTYPTCGVALPPSALLIGVAADDEKCDLTAVRTPAFSGADWPELERPPTPDRPLRNLVGGACAVAAGGVSCPARDTSRRRGGRRPDRRRGRARSSAPSPPRRCPFRPRRLDPDRGRELLQVCEGVTEPRAADGRALPEAIDAVHSDAQALAVGQHNPACGSSPRLVGVRRRVAARLVHAASMPAAPDRRRLPEAAAIARHPAARRSAFSVRPHKFRSTVAGHVTAEVGQSIAARLPSTTAIGEQTPP